MEMSSVCGGKQKEMAYMWCGRVECSRALGRQQRTTDLRRTQVLTKARKGLLKKQATEDAFVMEFRRRGEVVQTGTGEPYQAFI